MKLNELIAKVSPAPVLLAVGMALVPTLASAHPAIFHHYTLVQGGFHPFTGLDHLLAMVGVGLWASQQGGRALWLWPLAFVSLMLAGGALGMAGIALPMLEPMIAASVLVLGLLVASATTLPLVAGASLIGAFALVHGNAHGLEAPHQASAIAYAAGFAISTAALHMLGLSLGGLWQSDKSRLLVRMGGLASAAFGTMLIFA